MRRYLFFILSLSLITALVFTACQKQADLPYRYQAPDLPEESYSYAVPDDLPTHLTNNIGIFDTVVFLHSISDAQATLGRVLFYDRILSVNNRTSCGSCHQQSLGFADEAAQSPGFAGDLTDRNTQPLINLSLQRTFFWDSRVNDLNELVTQPIRHQFEMGMEDIDELPVKLAATSYYPGLFEDAYGDPEITKDRVAQALTQFLQSMFSYRSRFDHWFVTASGLTAQQRLGSDLFFGRANCSRCHGGGNLQGTWGEDWANIGLDSVYEDPGLGANNPSLRGVFKVPSLRNISQTAPYMHDGRFQNLREVVDHYSDHVIFSPILDWRLVGNDQSAARLALTNQEREALVAFMGTFTDEDFLRDDRFADPFPNREE